MIFTGEGTDGDGAAAGPAVAACEEARGRGKLEGT